MNLQLGRAFGIVMPPSSPKKSALPAGVSQTQWGADKVKSCFKEISVLALGDHLVKGIIGALNRTLFNVFNILPLPGLQGLAKVAQKAVDFSLTCIDESIPAHTFRTGNERVYEAAESGIILYCQAWKARLKNAVAITRLSCAFTIVSAVIFLIPLGAVAWMLPETWSFAIFGLFVLALFMGVSLKWILFDPIACTATILAFLTETGNIIPDPEWEGRIEAVCDTFRELKAKAAEQIRGAETPEAPPP